MSFEEPVQFLCPTAAQGFKAAPCGFVQFAHPSRGRGRRVKVSRQPVLNFAGKKKQRAFYEGQNVEWDVGEQEILQIFKEHLHNPHSLLPDSVNSAFLQRSMCVVFGYYWCIIWGGWGGVGKKGDGLGSFLLKFGETVKQRKEQLMMIGFSVQNIVSFQKLSLAT